jgi:hypothetical protein
MQTQYINELLNIPELHISWILLVDHNDLHIDATPVAHLQSRPLFLMEQHVIRKGTNGTRTVRHLSVFKRKSYLQVPAIRLFCTTCHTGFGWTDEFAGHKQRHSKLFRSLAVEPALGSTAAHPGLLAPV